MWIAAIFLTVIGLTGTLTIMGNKNSQSEDVGRAQPLVSPLVSAMSAARVVESGKPYLVYGTAWKKDETSRLVYEAIQSGFRFIDTACQPKHYNEKGVGDGMLQAMKQLGLSRSDLFIQTKFTSYNGQDPNRVPYDENAPLEDQVLQSLEVSLRNLRTEYIDSLVLHSPMETHEDTMRVWRVLEEKVEEGTIRQLGISNCYDIDHFKSLYRDAEVKPAVLQNRFYSDSGFDVELREFCADNDIWYQSFWTLTSRTTHARLGSEEIADLAKSKGLTPQTLMYAYMLEQNYLPLCGTTSQKHMHEDVAVMERIQGGEQVLNEDEMLMMSTSLGIE